MLYIQTLGKKFKTFRLVHDGKSPLIFKNSDGKARASKDSHIFESIAVRDAFIASKYSPTMIYYV